MQVKNVNRGASIISKNIAIINFVYYSLEITLQNGKETKTTEKLVYTKKWVAVVVEK